MSHVEEKLESAYRKAFHVIDEAQATERHRMREHAVRAALRRVQQGEVRPERSSGWRWRWLAAATMSLSAVTSLLLVINRPRPEPVAYRSPPVQSPPNIVPLPTPTVAYALVEGQAQSLAHAQIRAKRASRMVWVGDQRLVRLTDGEIDVAVDPRPKASFTVETPSFSVEVLGTRFVVSAQSVSVQEGHVMVYAPGSPPSLLADLRAGDQWTTEVAAIPRVTPQRMGSSLALLEQARSSLALGQTSRARTALQGVLAQRLAQHERAEAKSLLAECALVDGHHEHAATLYLEVAHENRGRPAGGTALFAAARAQMTAGNHAAAERLLLRYLDHYPSGPLKAEAQRRLQRIRTKP